MPFQSEKQRRYLHANHPEIAKRWERDYANGGISNHFQRRPFKKGSYSRSYNPGAPGGVVQHGPISTGGNGGGDHHPPVPVYTGPTAEEIAAQKAADEAHLQVQEDARRNQMYEDVMSRRDEKIKHKKKIEDMGFNEFQKFGTGVIDFGEDYYKNLAYQNRVKNQLWGADEYKNLILPGLIDQSEAQIKEWEEEETEETMSPALIERMMEILKEGKVPPHEIREEAEKDLRQQPYINERMGIGQGPILEAAHGGGILDINESEEIIDDDGNDIELTDYNAAFDDPKDLSTGVKTLFQAKDGGTPRRRYFTGAYGGGGTENTGGSTNRERGIQQAYSQPAYSPTGDAEVASQIAAEDRQIAAADRLRKQQLKNLVETGQGSPIEKYDTQAQHLADLPGKLDDNPYKSRVNVNYKNDNYQQTLANQKAKLKSMGLSKLMPLFLMIAFGVPPMDALKAFPKTISITSEDLRSLVTHGLPVVKAKKELIEALEIHKGGLLKDVDITNPNEMVNLEETTDFTKTRDQLTELTATPEDDDTGGDGPELPEVPQVVSIGGESEQYAQPDFNYWGFIKDKQAQKKAYDVKMAQENLMLQQPGLAYGQQFFNKGGLANLFRVKNQ